MKDNKKVNFRKYLSKHKGVLFLAGKNDLNNEELVLQTGKDEYVLHTAAPGSPFVNIKSNFSDVDKNMLKEAAIFCAAYSRDWKKNHKDVSVHVFLGKDLYKDRKTMKAGTFGVKKMKKIIVKKEEIERFLKERNKE